MKFYRYKTIITSLLIFILFFPHAATAVAAGAYDYDAQGQLAQTLDYYPFGAVRIDQRTGVFSEQKKFTGKELDKDTGLYYYGARYYNGGAGRFISIDPLFFEEGYDIEDPQSLNSYAYSRNNPVKYIDQNGESYALPLQEVKLSLPSLSGFAAAFGTIGAGVIAFGGALGIVGSVMPLGAIKGSDDAKSLTQEEKAAISPKAPNNSANNDGKNNKNDKKSDKKQASGKKPDGNDYTKKDSERMKQGKSPLDKDGKPIELHHEGQKPEGPFKEMTRDQHRGKGNYSPNHPNGNSEPSQIDRNSFKQQRQEYWKNKANQININ